eukprot:NODE_1678_length_1415_cov_154.507764_g1592_i0.p1 GENE.NODE_1678_length_1415_cov_154.507764_g1592_i0~~NODE_1678_length_1415_cov_154.507764_g1592_i0.p1  ORF type:complete len:419 (-),score=125.97 NODE_1678_length_1415_cov_154.507764_g1592_i0:58-1314(-)
MTSRREVLGHYELGKALGKGSFSSVRACTDINTGKVYAMKILDKQTLVDQNMGAQVNREIALMLKMSHRNICTMRECFQTHDKVYIILELVEGGELFDKIKENKRLDEDKARDFFQQLILGLNYCHKHGIAHRDLKPENLLLDKNDVIKLSDFGLSNTQKTSDSGRVNPSMMLKTVCGTPNYVAPEVLLESGYNGFQADMWSAGVILYVMLAGKLPFYDKVMQNLFRKISTGTYTVPDHFSEGVRELISKLMCVKPKERYTVDDVIKDPWFRVGFKDEWLEDGELVRTPSQEQINKAITQLREQQSTDKEKKEPTAASSKTPAKSPAPKVKRATKPAEEEVKKTRPSTASTRTPPTAGTGTIKNMHATRRSTEKPSSHESQVAEKQREFDALAKQKEEMDRKLELRRKEIENLRMGKK